MAAYTWTFKSGALSYGSGNWSTGADWSTAPANAPGFDGTTTDTVLIKPGATTTGANFTVTLAPSSGISAFTLGALNVSPTSSATGTAATLLLNGFSLNAGALTLTSQSAAVGSIISTGTSTLGWTSTTFTASVGSGGVIEAQSGTLTLTGTLAAASSTIYVNLEVGSGATLDITGAIAGTTQANGDKYAFLSSSSGEFQFAAATFAANLTGMNVGTNLTATNFIDVAGTATAAINENTGASPVLTVTEGANTETFYLSGMTGTYYAKSISDGNGGTEIFLSSQACYAAGTRILTPDGDVAVEALAEGDMVVTLDGNARGAAPVAWIGYRKVDVASHPRPELVAPVRIRRDAFGQGMPQRDLVVSPDHALYVDDRLVVARLLINNMTITQDFAVESIVYYHVELPQHAILLADGLPAESYLDTGNRAMFANAGLALVLHPDFGVSQGVRTWEADACAPLATAAAEVEPMWRRLAERAESLGYVSPVVATTTEADLHLMVDGRRIQPVSTRIGRHVFVLPRNASSMRLMSRACAPAQIAPYREDRRLLGVAVSQLVLRQGAEQVQIPVDHPMLSRGWHAVEREGQELRRWTDGGAELPIQFGTGDGPMMLEVHTTSTNIYQVVETSPHQRLAA